MDLRALCEVFRAEGRLLHHNAGRFTVEDEDAGIDVLRNATSQELIVFMVREYISWLEGTLEVRLGDAGIALISNIGHDG